MNIRTTYAFRGVVTLPGEVIGGGSVVTAQIILGGRPISPRITLADGAPADWANGIVAFTFPGSVTKTFPITHGKARADCEIAVDDDPWVVGGICISQGFKP